MIKLKNIKINNKRATKTEEELLKTYIIDCLQKDKNITSLEIIVT